MVPIRVRAPEGTVVNPVLPAACGARGVIGYRVYDAIMGALAPIVPDRVLAAGEGGPTLIALGGYDEERRPFGTTEVIVGTWGARATRDGLEGVSNPLANLAQPAGRAARGRHPDRGRELRARAGLRWRRAAARRPRVRASLPRTHAQGNADDPHRSARPSPLRARGRRARCTVEQHRHLRRRASASCRRCRWQLPRSSRATASSTSRQAGAASACRSSAIRTQCWWTCSTARCRSRPLERATAS